MTKRIVEIVSIGDNNGTGMYPCRYEYEGKTYMLTAENKMEIFTRTTIKDAPSELILTLTKKNGSKKYTFNDGEGMTENDINIKEVVDVFWSKYPSAIINGSEVANPNFVIALLDVRDLNQQSLASYEKWVIQRKCAEILDNSDEEKIRNIGYSYGISVRGMKRGELIMLLGNWSNGIIYNNTTEFLSSWSSNSENKDRDMVINFRKSVTIGIVTIRNIDGISNYYIEETCIGTSENACIDYLRRNMKLYQDFIVSQVDEKEKGTLEDFKNEIKTVNLIKDITKEGNVTAEEYNLLNKEIATLVSQNYIEDKDYSRSSVQDLREIIKQGKEKKKLSKQTVK